MNQLITAGNAVWCLVFAGVLHLLVATRAGDRIPGRIADDILPRIVLVLVLAGVAGLVSATIGPWLNRAMTACAAKVLAVTHLPLGSQIVIAALAFAATVSVLMWIVAGTGTNGRYVLECTVAAALLVAIPGTAGKVLLAAFGAVVWAGAFVVALVFGAA